MPRYTGRFHKHCLRRAHTSDVTASMHDTNEARKKTEKSKKIYPSADFVTVDGRASQGLVGSGMQQSPWN